MLSAENLSRVFPGRSGRPAVKALDGVSLDVERGEFFALLGPSGCGKTTLLGAIAGLETPDTGRLSIDGAAVFDDATGVFAPPQRRAIGMVFQSYAIWPHLTVFENVAFPLLYGAGPRPAPAEVRRRVVEALSVVKLADHVDRPAPHLSGGQQQRVALARAIVPRPRLLLLDEPLSNLDARLRDEMRIELRQLVKSLGITAIFVTHDQVEAMGMADRIALMQAGRVIALGAPDDVYFRPSGVFAASFMGQGNVLLGVVETDGGRRRLRTPAGALAAPDDAARLPDGAAVTVIVRPHEFQFVAALDGPQHDLLTGVVRRDSLLGAFREFEIAVGDALLRVNGGAHETRPVGSTVHLRIAPGGCIVLPAAAASGVGA